ncbi:MULTISPECIES: hypothetical protein [unclassified Pseudomonas]|uniref:hypothetical protein n=1 Tax=unclassified Pseudomonas TaxID=196821 RepID=UPI0002F076D3|nr:hypothetical protein [Pseudomonas sp. M47T1]
MTSDPLDRSKNPLAPDPVPDARPGDENLPPTPLDEDPELDPDKVRTETGDDDMSPDDPR